MRLWMIAAWRKLRFRLLNLFWLPYYSRLFIEMFLELTFYTILSICFLWFDTFVCVISSLVTMAILLLTAWFILYSVIKVKSSKKKIPSHYSLQFELFADLKQKYLALLYHPLFFLRWLLYVLMLIFLWNNKLG